MNSSKSKTSESVPPLGKGATLYSFANKISSNKKPEFIAFNRKKHPISLLLAVLLMLSVFLMPSGEIAQAEDGLQAGSIARVSGTDGDGVRMRTSPDAAASVITTLNETWQVTVLGGPVKDNQGNRFYKIEWANRTGYVMVQYLSKSGSGGFGVGSQVRVTGTDGDGVRMRQQPNASAKVVTTLDENWLATVTGGPFKDGQGNTFYKLEWAGRVGYASSQYLTYAGKGTISSSTTSSSLTVGGQAKVVGTDGEGVRMRQQPNGFSSTLNVLGETYLVTVLGGPFNDNQGNSYHRVEWAGYTGYVNSKFLSSAGKAAVAGQGGFMRITNTDGDPIRFRTAPNRDSDTNGYVYEGQSFKILAGPFKDAAGGTWYRLERNGDVGYVDASFLQRTTSQTTVNPAPAKPNPKAEPAPAPRPIPVPPSSGPLGQRISDYAKQFVGYRYVWGGKSPSYGGFDCSGFVYWVFGQVAGVNTGASVESNLAVGVAVPLDALEPGDILIWVNTYKPGPSHAGIYIGGGRFVHAETESTGVTISGMSESYYASRLYAARRVGV